MCDAHPYYHGQGTLIEMLWDTMPLGLKIFYIAGFVLLISFIIWWNPYGLLYHRKYEQSGESE